jgi:4-hydroxy-tetrahydrodipicolinate synthase
MIECGRRSDVDGGRGHAEALLPLVHALFAEPSPAVIKALLHTQGRIPTAAVRMPLAAATPAARERGLDALRLAEG